MNKLDTLKASVASTPGASWRPEELLFRLKDEGGKTIIGGAHVTVLVSEPDHDGTTAKTVYGPFPVSTLSDDPTLKSLLGDVLLSQQAAIDAKDAQLEANATDMRAQAKAIADLEAKLAAANAKLAAIVEEK